MAISKVILDGDTIMDVTDSTSEPGTMLSGTVGYKADGVRAVGTVTVPTKTSDLVNDGSDGNDTYVESGDLATVATTGSYSDLSNKPAIPDSTSDLTNDSNFVSDASYVHTDNNYTSTEKSKLSGIASGAEVNVQADWNVTTTTSDAYIKNKPSLATVATSGAYSDLSGKPTIPTATSDLTNDSNYVADASYVHTDNNYTSTEKSKLSGIASGAEVNVQSDWSVTTTTSDAFIKNKPTIPTKTSDLTNDSGYITSSAIPTKTSDLTNDSNFVVDANYVHTDSNYTSTEKSKLSGIAAGAEVNVQANWTETSSTSDAYIQNKPNLATVATSGSYADLSNKPTIPTATSQLTNDSGFQEVIRLDTTSSTYSEAESAYNAFVSNDPPAIYVDNALVFDVLFDPAEDEIWFHGLHGETVYIFSIDGGGSSWTRDTIGLARLQSPTFTGIPKAPTASSGTNTTQIATTAFVQDATSGFIAEDADGDVSITRNINAGGDISAVGDISTDARVVIGGSTSSELDVLTTASQSSSPSENTWQALGQIVPSLGADYLGAWGHVKRTSGESQAYMAAGNSQSGSRVTNILYLGVDANGNKTVSLDQNAWLNALGLTTTDWVYMKGSSSSSDQYARWRAKAGIVFVEWYFTTGSGHSGSAVTLGTISSGYRPSKHISGACYGTGNNVLWWEITTAGNLTFSSKGSSTSPAVYGTASYPL